MCGIICPIQDIISSLYDLKSPCLCNHTPYIWHRVHGICFITSTVLMISHQMYLWDPIRYNSRYHIHSIWHDSHCMTSQPLHSWHQIPYIWYHLQGLWHLVPYTCDMTDTMFVNTCQIYLTLKTHGAKGIQPLYLKSQPPYVYVCDHTNCIDDITHTVFMTWHLLYLWHNMHCIWHLNLDLWHQNTLSITSVYYISYQSDYIWQHTHWISVITSRFSII